MPEYEYELATNFDFGSKLKGVLEEQSRFIRAQGEELADLSPPTPLTSSVSSHCEDSQLALRRQQAQEEPLSPLTPLTSPTASHCESQPALPVSPCLVPYDDQLFGLPALSLSSQPSLPYCSPSSSKEPLAIGGSKKDRRRENRRQKRKRDAATNPESPVTGDRNQKRRRVNRKSRRERDMIEPVTHPEQGGYGQTMYVKPSVPLKIETNFKEARVASTGYIGLDDDIRMRTEVPLQGLLDGTQVGRKFSRLEWDGKSSTPITDIEKRLFVVLPSMPKDEAWDGNMRDGAEALEVARHDCDLHPEDANHRRGNYLNLRTGVSMGRGQTCPMVADNSKCNNEILDRLNSMECFQKLAKFTTSALKTWAPKLHARYATNMKALRDRHKSLRFPFLSSVFPSTTYNLGPRTLTFPHRDFLNAAFGWCAITALGFYDYKKGGHLILWDLDLVIEFPPGATIMIPSAVLTHSNVTIAEGEHRYSVTQYAAGGLFRWVDNGFKTNRSLSRKERKRRQQEDFT